MVVFGQKMFYSGRSGSIRAKLMLFGQSCCISATVVLFAKKWLYSGKSSSIRAISCIWEKIVVFGQGGCMLEKVFVFGQNLF